ncbi:hypothetical protein BDQ17DRAFT_1324269 [Cyathus striatus]|nr:hypothetical protein BDQ17DRAFT_1324269 [Cyathus striatus]
MTEKQTGSAWSVGPIAGFVMTFFNEVGFARDGSSSPGGLQIKALMNSTEILRSHWGESSNYAFPEKLEERLRWPDRSRIVLISYIKVRTRIIVTLTEVSTLAFDLHLQNYDTAYCGDALALRKQSFLSSESWINIGSDLSELVKNYFVRA